MTDSQENGLARQRDMTRRRMLVRGGAGLAAVGLGTAATGSATAEPTDSAALAEACYQLTKETIEGPYYLDYDLFRRNITEDRDGIPLTLLLKVIDAGTCAPVHRAAVDVWQCDALGVYSGYTDAGSGGDTPPGGGHQEPTDNLTYLRGSQFTDRSGVVEFRTIFPGWYEGRCVHIHVKVHLGGRLTMDGYDGGHTAHTGQLFFAEDAVLASAKLDPYRASTTERTTLDEDFVYTRSGGGTEAGLLALDYREDDIGRGVRAALTLGIDPEATPDGS